MGRNNSCSYFMAFVALMHFFTVALAAKHELLCSSHTQRIITADQENLVNVSSNGLKIVNLTQSNLVWCGNRKLPITVLMEFSEPVLVTDIVVNGRKSSYVSQFKLSYKDSKVDKFVPYQAQEFKPHSSETQQFNLSPAINSTNFKFHIQEFNKSSYLYCWHIDMHGCLSVEASLYEPSSTTTSSTPIGGNFHPTIDAASTTTVLHITKVPALTNDDQLQTQLHQIFIISVAGLVTSAVMICVTIIAVSIALVYCTLKKRRVGDIARTPYAIGPTVNPSYVKSSNSNAAVPAAIYEQVEL